MIVTCSYDPTGLAWVILEDHPVVAWMIDDTGTLPPAPAILRSMPALPPDTTPVNSPTWIMVAENTVFAVGIVELTRAPVVKTSQYVVHGTPHDMFIGLSSNNGAVRSIWANFYNLNLVLAWNHWSNGNPLALTEPPNGS
jgi:hypothetical protein